MRRVRSENGQALIEAALTIPLLLLIAVGIFEFGRAYQTWEVLTNAAREGARTAILPGSNPAAVQSVVVSYMKAGQLGDSATAEVIVNSNSTITVNGVAVSASRVTINYPFNFIVLKPVASLIANAPAKLGSPLTIQASAQMRNEM